MHKRKGKEMTNTKTRSSWKFTAEIKAKVAMEALLLLVVQTSGRIIFLADS